MKNSMEVPQTTKNRVAIWPSAPTPGHISGQNYYSKRYMYPHVHRSAIHNSQDMETTSMSTDRWMDKEDVVHIYNEIVLSYKKEWNNAICSNMGGPRDYHTKWSKSNRERQISYDIAYKQNLKKNEPTYKMLTNQIQVSLFNYSWLSFIIPQCRMSSGKAVYASF